jgi:hypothetical protein
MRFFAFAVDQNDGSVVITIRDGHMHTCFEMDAEEFGEFVGQANGAFGESKVAAS